MNDLGIAVDVSHMSDAAIWDVIEVSRAPIVASHSNCRAVHDHRRNLPDDLIRTICADGGVIGLVFYWRYLSGDRDASMQDVVAHAKHLKEVGGAQCIALGSDWDGDVGVLADLDGASQLQDLRQQLLDAGFSEQEVDGIFGANALRALTEIERIGLELDGSGE